MCECALLAFREYEAKTKGSGGSVTHEILTNQTHAYMLGDRAVLFHVTSYVLFRGRNISVRSSYWNDGYIAKTIGHFMRSLSARHCLKKFENLEFVGIYSRPSEEATEEEINLIPTHSFKCTELKFIILKWHEQFDFPPLFE